MGEASLLKCIALDGISVDVRGAAADSIDHPAFLTSIALNTSDIELGRNVIARIPFDLLLRRISRSAREDAVRLFTAKSLNDNKLLKDICRGAADVSLRWQVACQLNDPELLDEIAHQNPMAGRFATIQRQAYAALLAYLDLSARQDDTNALLSFFWAQPYLPFVLEAFLRLPDESIRKALLQHLARQNYACISHEIIRQMLIKIRTAGWRLSLVSQVLACIHCNDTGEMKILKVTCAGDDNHQVAFHLPPSAAIGALDLKG